MLDLRRDPISAGRLSAAPLARRVAERLGGRFSSELGIDVDRGGVEVERWALAATLFGTRISAQIAMRTYRVLSRAGVKSVADAGERSWEELVALLDEGGYVRYDFQTASRLRALAEVTRERCGGGIASLAAIRDPAELEVALDALPGWGPVTVSLFLRELRGVWPGADPQLDRRALEGAEHLALVPPAASATDARARLSRLARAAGLDFRDLESALVRLSLAHGRAFTVCPGGDSCGFLEDGSR